MDTREDRKSRFSSLAIASCSPFLESRRRKGRAPSTSNLTRPLVLQIRNVRGRALFSTDLNNRFFSTSATSRPQLTNLQKNRDHGYQHSAREDSSCTRPNCHLLSLRHWSFRHCQLYHQVYPTTPRLIRPPRHKCRLPPLSSLTLLITCSSENMARKEPGQ